MINDDMAPARRDVTTWSHLMYDESRDNSDTLAVESKQAKVA